MKINRIVKLIIKTESIELFKTLFKEKREKINAFDGCHSVELYQEINTPNIIFTYSVWDSEEALNSYRNSDFFKATWKVTKTYFDGKPEAWSIAKL